MQQSQTLVLTIATDNEIAGHRARDGTYLIHMYPHLVYGLSVVYVTTVFGHGRQP
jgi:hypothetical protein